MTTLKELVALLRSPAALREIEPALRLDEPWSRSVALGRAPPSGDEVSRWASKHGLGVLAGALDERTCATLVRAIDALRTQGYPAVFVYAFDDVWALGESVRARIASVLDREYRLVEDVWAWHIPPGHGGWPPHRGLADVHLDPDRPEILNVWVALSDVTSDRACMHAVPLDADPAYPDAMHRLDAPVSAIRAMPVTAGDGLFWNANVLHWGGRCAEHAAGPRVSCSFTLCRSDASERFRDLVMLPPLTELDLSARMDAVARMIVLYGKAQPDVTDIVREWAALTVALASRFGGTAAPFRKAP